MSALVAVLRTRPQTVIADYGRLMRLVKYDQVLPRDQELIVKLNLSWTKYFPACSSQPWQVDGVLNTLVEDGYDRARVHAVENRTVVTDPVEGCRNNKWEPVLRRHGFTFTPLTDVEWIRYPFTSPLLKLNKIFPEGIEIPKMYVGKNVLHMPTVKCVHPDTEIMLADGALVRAESLVKAWQVREPTMELPDGDRVSEGQVRVVAVAADGGLTPGHATHFWRTPLTGESLWTVRTRTGRSVVTSHVHPFLTPEGWTPAHTLRPGDRIAIARRVRLTGASQPLPGVHGLGHDAVNVDALPIRAGRKYGIEEQRDIIRAYIAGESITSIARRMSTNWRSLLSVVHRYGVASRWRRVWARAPHETTTSFWRWWGYFTAEGYAYDCNGSYRVSFANTDPDVRRDYIELSATLFGVEPKCRGIEIYFDALNLRSLFEALGFTVPTNSATKIVPDILFKCPDAEIAAFVQGYLDGDGCVDKVGVTATTKSSRLAAQIQMLLSRLGIVAFLGTTWARATNGRATAKQEYSKLSIYGDDVVTLSTWMTFRCAHRQRALEVLRRRREAGVRPSNWDTIPLAPALFRMVREGLGLTHATSMKPSAVNSIENGYTEPTRPVMRHFIELFSRLDTTGRFSDEISYMRFLASNDLAWDWVDDVRSEPAEVPFLYDLSVEGAQSFVGNGIILHNTHGHSVTTGAIKNSFGGLLKEVRHHAHEFIHEVMVDLMYMQRELHPGVFAVMDGTVMGDGAGPRTMVPRVGNLLLASQDQVAIDAIAARIMGFDPLSIPYLAMCHERGLGVADARDIEIVGDVEAAATNMGFKTSRSLVIWGDQLIRRGPLRPLKRLLLHSPLMVWAPFASNVYHDWLWYPTVGRTRIRAFAATPWGRLFGTY